MPQVALSSSSCAGTFNHDKVKPEFNQYWYSANTIDALVSEVRHHATSCAFLSCPSLFFALDARKGNESPEEEAAIAALRSSSRIFEFDKQWAGDAGFVAYDFRYPEQVPIQYMGAFDYVVADPPFITEDVWEAYVQTTKLLLKDGGKLLFTTVLENHTMLEGLINGPLFIPPFRPCVRQLTYQYVCFLNYDATRLTQPNTELMDFPEDAKVLAAIRMANDLRRSEKEFALQMTQRSRVGEVQLPTKAHEEDMKRLEASGDAHNDHHKDLAQVPIEEMRWGYVPEGLTMYANGATAMSSEEAVEERDYGEAYNAAAALRTHLDLFKGGIDSLQKMMDKQMRLRHRRMRLRKELAAAAAAGEAAQPGTVDAARALELEAAVEELTMEVDACEVDRHSELDKMTALAAEIEAGEAALAAMQSATEGAGASCATHTPYAAAMAECVAAYREVEVKKSLLQELAADATRKFKSPLFNRMKELLQDMKDIKKRQQ